MTDQALNGWQKLDKTVDCMQKGDVKCVQETLNTVQDQKLFMDLLGSRAQGSSGLPGLQIFDGDKDGHTDAIKVTAGKNKMTIALDPVSGKDARVTDDSPTFKKSISNAIDYVVGKVENGAQAAKEAFNAAPPIENLSRSMTTDSDFNRLQKYREKKAGLEPVN
jgi:hypothetical protein